MLLDKPFGWKRTAGQIARAQEALRRLQQGSLERGELYQLITGTKPLAPSEQHAGPLLNLRSKCLDCSLALAHAGPPLKSQPARCRPCGTQKRQAHNQSFRNPEASTPEPGAGELERTFS